MRSYMGNHVLFGGPRIWYGNIKLLLGGLKFTLGLHFDRGGVHYGWWR